MRNLVVNHDVFGLQVSVDDALGVKVLDDEQQAGGVELAVLLSQQP